MPAVAELLAELIAYDTRNPEGDERPMAGRLGEELARRKPDQVQVVELPPEPGQTPHAYVLARWGTPRTLINVHLDTVPANTGWTASPHRARFEGGRLYGLGASDTKGAIAAILCALDEARPADTAILFSGDEEHGGTVVRHCVQAGVVAGIERAVVCEPTGLRVGTRHRGILAFEIDRRGAGGHSSNADRMPAPLADLARVAVAFADWSGHKRGEGPPGFEGLCANVARLEGGVAFNVVPDAATLSLSLRPPPGADSRSLATDVRTLAHAVCREADVRTVLDNPPFHTRDLAAYRSLLGDLVDAPLDMGFWTEAAVLSAAGIDAVVFGPGDIRQAHAPDEWVTIAELDRARDVFVRLFHGRG